MALRAVCGVRLLVKGMAINFEPFLASLPAKPLSLRVALKMSACGVALLGFVE